MAVYTQVSAEEMAGFIAGFDVGELVSAKGIAEGVENSNYLVETTGADGQGARFILTLYERRVAEADLPYFLALLDHLAAKGLPVPPAVADRAGIKLHRLRGRPACLIRFLPGLSPGKPTERQAVAAGRALGDMHRAAADFVLTRPNSMGANHWRGLYDKCGRDLDRIAPGLHDEVGAMLDDVLSAWPDHLPVGTIHADLFPDNVLMRAHRVTGLIDFYFACTDLRIYDLAVMHSAWAFAPGGHEYRHAIGIGVIQGYFGNHGITPEEAAAFPLLARGACIRFLLSRAWDWLNTPADALVTRKDPLDYLRRYRHYETMKPLGG